MARTIGINQAPNRVVCYCMKQIWFVSQKVQGRALSCPKCYRYYRYKRSLDGKFDLKQVGRWRTKLERDMALRKHARAEIERNMNVDMLEQL